MADRYAGTIVKLTPGKFGFVKPDDGSADMFVLPQHCAAFGNELPPIDCRITYTIVADAKTGRPRAEDVMPEDELQQALNQTPLQSYAPAPHGQPVQGSWAPPQDSGFLTGTMLSHNGKFGFIQQESGEPDMFILPALDGRFGHGPGFPPEGSRVVYAVVSDAKTGKPRAEDVRLEQAAAYQAPVAYHPPVQRPAAPMLSKGKGGLHPVGFKGAGGFQPGSAQQKGGIHLGGGYKGAGKAYAPVQPVQASFGGFAAGTVVKNSFSFGFVKPDDGSKDLFLMPCHCESFGRELPQVGTRVVYVPGIDPQKGMPSAEQVQPEQGFVGGSAGNGMLSGTMLKANGGFGFIQMDDGQADMFLMAASCQAFGNELPAIGTRLNFSVVTDQKTGRPRAEEVMPEGGGPAPPSGKGKGKGKGFRASPY